MPQRSINSFALQRAATFVSPVFMASLGVFAFVVIRGEERAMKRVSEASETTSAYQDLLLDIRDIQSTVRTFIITGTAADYNRYTAARTDIRRDLQDMSASPAGKTMRQWPELERLVSVKLALSDSTVAAKIAGRPEIANELIGSYRGIAAVRGIDVLVRHAIAAEKAKLSEAVRARRRYVDLLTLFVPLGTLLAALIAAGLNRALTRYARREEAQHRIAQRLNAELSIREARFRALIENAHDVIAIGSQDLQLNFVSPSVNRVLGFTPAELVKKSDVIRVHPEDIPSIQGTLRLLPGRSPGEVVTGTMRLQRKNGEWRVLEYAAINMLDNPAVQGIVCNAHDITEEQRLQEQLLQSQKMEAIGRLAGGIAHDFNNLITAIKGNLGFALKELEPGHSVRDDLREVDRAADRAATLTRQLLAFSRKQVLEPRIVDCCAVVEQFQRMISRVIGENILFRTRLPDSPQPIHVDPGQLEQVLMNLAVNARDAMPHGGTITVEVGREYRDVAWPGERNFRPGEYVVISVTDTGTGMSAEVQSRIFEPFFTTKESGHGTGLGLSLVYGIVKQSGGYVNVYSEVAHGTRFRIYLPLSEATPHQLTENAAAPSNVRGTERILLVEDEPTVRALASRALRLHGYDVIEADNGAEALEKLEAASGIDLMISDLVMPGMHGLQLCELAKQKRPELRVLLMSGYSDADIGALDPAVSWLEKPFTIDSLARRVRTILDNH